jgi:hypothetical protein
VRRRADRWAAQGQMAPLARLPLPRAAAARRPGLGARCGLQSRGGQATRQTGRVHRLPRQQPKFYCELRGPLPPWRADHVELRRVGGEYHSPKRWEALRRKR